MAKQEDIFKKVFEIAEIAKFTPAEREAYEDSLKHYRDIKNIVDASIKTGIKTGIIKVAKKMKDKGLSNDEISEFTGLSNKEVDEL